MQRCRVGIDLAHESEQRIFQEAAGRHGGKPARLGDDEYIRIAMQDCAGSRDAGLHPRWPMPGDLIALADPIFGLADSLAQRDLTAANALRPLLA